MITFYRIYHKNKKKKNYNKNYNNKSLKMSITSETSVFVEKLKEENEKLKKRNECQDRLIKAHQDCEKLLERELEKLKNNAVDYKVNKQLIYFIINGCLEGDSNNSDFMICFGELPNTIKYNQHSIDYMEELGFNIITESMIDDCWTNNWEEFISSEGYEEGDDEYEEARNSPWSLLDGYDCFPDYCFDNNLIDCEEYYSMDCNSEYSLYGTVYWIYNSP